MSPRAASNPVFLRVLSAVVLGPPVIAIIYAGTPAFEALVIVAAALLAREWFRLCGDGLPTATGFAFGAVLLAAIAVQIATGLGWAVALLAAGALLVWALARERRAWLGCGVLYIGLPCAAVLWLRDLPEGRDVVLWMICVVWAADTGAYVAGRLIGGPKLAPRISPKKTWAGLVGGMTLAACVSVAYARLNGQWHLVAPGALGALLGFAGQAGDLAESWMKRRFGVKDAGRLIPGHGGLLDRVDALMAVILVVAFIVAADEDALSRWL